MTDEEEQRKRAEEYRKLIDARKRGEKPKPQPGNVRDQLEDAAQKAREEAEEAERKKKEGGGGSSDE